MSLMIKNHFQAVKLESFSIKIAEKGNSAYEKFPRKR